MEKRRGEESKVKLFVCVGNKQAQGITRFVLLPARCGAERGFQTHSPPVPHPPQSNRRTKKMKGTIR